MDVCSVSADANHRVALPLPPPPPPPPPPPTHSHLKQHESHTVKLDCCPSPCLHSFSYANEASSTNRFIKTNTKTLRRLNEILKVNPNSQSIQLLTLSALCFVNDSEQMHVTVKQ